MAWDRQRFKRNDVGVCMVIASDLFPFERNHFTHPSVKFAHRLAAEATNLEGSWQQHYVDEGDAHAPAVLMLHGNPTWSFYFRQLIPALSGRHRVIVPDHAGCGLSQTPSLKHFPYTLDAHVDALEALIDSLDLQGQITLVLHDWGGMIGMAYAARHPQRIGRIVAMNTAAFHMPPAAKLPWQIRLARNKFLGQTLVQGCNAFALGAARMCVTNPLSEDVRAAYLAPYGSWHERLAVRRFVEDIPISPGDPSYATVSQAQNGLWQFRQTPVLLCWGMQDFVFDRTFLERWLAYLPQAAVHRFADAGHWILEDAGSAVVPLITAFLEKPWCQTTGKGSRRPQRQAS